MRPEIENEIAAKKSQLAGYLAACHVDLSLVLGFTSILQDKFRNWLLEDITTFKNYESTNKQLDPAQFASIDLLQSIWSSFHYPIVKMYQRQHAEVLSMSVKAFRDSSNKESNADPKENRNTGANKGGLAKKGNKGNKPKNSAKQPPFRAVEMRKLNESFTKFIKSAELFYTGFLHEFAKQPNRLIPSDYLREFDIIVSHESTSSSETHSSYAYAICHCLLSLGNLERSKANCIINYAEPGKSVSSYHKHQKKTASGEKWKKELYLYSMFCYQKCIGLMPTMHEPYNHLAVIYNSLDQKFQAVLWFLRAQSTRDTNISIPAFNLKAIFSKPWLHEAYVAATKKPNLDTDAKNAFLLRIIGDYYYPKAFSRPLYLKKAQADFLRILQSDPVAEASRVILDHLTVLFSFSSMAMEVESGFQDFVVQYVQTYLEALGSAEVPEKNIEGVLMVVRFILAFFRKRRVLHQSKKLRWSFVKVLNLLINFDTEDTKAKSLEAFAEGKPPIRTHYFYEDVFFKDYVPIGCQFKDFNDAHLFKSKNINLLFGSSLDSRNKDIPDFLDNEAVSRILKDGELNEEDPNARKVAIATECTRCENTLRLRAITAMTKSIFGPTLSISADSEAFEAEKVDVVGSQVTPEKKPASGKKQKPSGVTQKPKLAPSSWDEIEQMIKGHAPKLSNMDVNDGSIVKMVNAIVSEEVQSSAEKQSATNEAVHVPETESRHEELASESDRSPEFDTHPAHSHQPSPAHSQQPHIHPQPHPVYVHPYMQTYGPQMGEGAGNGYGHMPVMPGMMPGPGMASYNYPMAMGPHPYPPVYFQGVPMQGSYEWPDQYPQYQQ